MTGGDQTSLLRGLRRDPGHASELILLHVLAQVGPHVSGWREALVRRHPEDSPEQLARLVIRRAAVHARRDGAVTGSSFYIGSPVAMASLYCRQVLLVLQIGALFGRAPTDPARAADILVFQGRHPDVATASAALRDAGVTHARSHGPRPSLWTVAGRTLRQVPGMVGIKVRKFRDAGLVNGIISAAETLSYVVPVLSIPAWAAGNARATRKLGHAAVESYSTPLSPSQTSSLPAGFILPPPISRTRRRLRAASGVVLCAVPVLLAVFFPGDPLAAKRTIVVVLTEVFLLLTVGRLLWVARGADSHP